MSLISQLDLLDRLAAGHVGRLVQWLGSVAQLCVGGAALFAGIAEELDTINGEHVPANQTLGIAGHQYLGEQGFYLGTEVGHKLGYVGVAGLAVATEGDELDVAQVCLLDDSARYQALAVGQQDDLEHDVGVIGAGT